MIACVFYSGRKTIVFSPVLEKKKESVNSDTVQYGHCDGLVLSAGESADSRTLMTVKGSLLLVNKQE